MIDREMRVGARGDARMGARVGMILLGAWCWSGTALAGSQLIGGVVTDRNGEPIARAQIGLTPGNIELVTGRDGRFEINYLRDNTGERVKLSKKTEYTLEVFRPGYHLSTMSVAYKRGVLELEPVTLVEETVAMEDWLVNIAPDPEDDKTHGNGHIVEGW